MPDVIIPIGLPGSGKSTLRERYVGEHPGTCVISPDEIRMKMLDFEHTGIASDKRIEDAVWREVFEQFDECLKGNNNIYFDATNLSTYSRRAIIDKIDKRKFKIIALHIVVDPWLAIVRNEKRKRIVPAERILAMSEMLMPPDIDEGFDKILQMYYFPTRNEVKEIRIRKEEYARCKI